MPSFTKTLSTLTLATLALLRGAAAFDGDLTYYTPGLGSCGRTNTETDKIVAVAPAQYVADPDLCGKSITIHLGGKTATATVVDKCMGCSDDSIDVAPAVFEELADLSVGRAKVTWFVD
ncbi:RlpA-like double-psi beta-barrel-protein domain-containing protein-containing protein [Hypoxylon sp. FL1284]|nr:RlpA-like double-psi beta-barrel-protein domain-containing protein-containing protein [Hypoxylon sp. FL1284]